MNVNRFKGVVMLMLLFAPSVLAQEKTISRLREVKTVYIDSLGDSEGAKLIREKLVNRLAMSNRISVTENRDEADAIITGIAQLDKIESGSVHTNSQGGSGSYGTGYDATLVVRLITSDKRILWVSEAKPGKFFVSSVSSSVADKVSKELLKAIQKDDKKKN